MSRFDYLDDKKSKKSARKKSPDTAGKGSGGGGEQAEAVYVRRETIRAAWREYRQDGGESLSELVEDLLLEWLRERV